MELVELDCQNGDGERQINMMYPPNDNPFNIAPINCISNSLSATEAIRSGITDQEKKVEEAEKPRFWKQACKCLLGHGPLFTEFIDKLQTRPALFHLVLPILESIVRSIGIVIFSSNPLSGAIILGTMIYSVPSATFFGMVALISGILTALLLFRLPMEVIRGGSVTFNCFLLGSYLEPYVDSKEFGKVGELIPLSIAVGVFAIFCWKGLDGLLSQTNVPVLNAPCNILSLIILYSGLAASFRPGQSSEMTGISFLANATSEDLANFNEKKGMAGDKNGTLFESKMEEEYERILEGTFHHGSIDWYKVLDGIILAQGQIFQTNSVVTSGLVYFSVLIYSPILFCQELLGAVIGTLIGVGLSQQGYNDVYDGSWAYNSLLTAGALGGIFIAFSFQAWVLSLVGSIISTLIYSTLTNNGIPALGMPFMLTTWLFLPIASFISTTDSEEKDDHSYKVYRVSNFTTPEINRRCCTITNIVSVDKNASKNCRFIFVIFEYGFATKQVNYLVLKIFNMTNPENSFLIGYSRSFFTFKSQKMYFRYFIMTIDKYNIYLLSHL